MYDVPFEFDIRWSRGNQSAFEQPSYMLRILCPVCILTLATCQGEPVHSRRFIGHVIEHIADQVGHEIQHTVDEVSHGVEHVVEEVKCLLTSCEKPEEVNNNAPHIYCDPKPQEFLAPPKSLTAVARWTLPSAHDDEDGSLTPKLAGSKGPGSTFTEGTHTINYRATDSRGVRSTCSIIIVIKVARCNEPSPVLNGIKTCSNTSGSTVRGDTCSYSCKDGYTRTGASILTCDKSGSFHPGLPTCEPVQCPAPKDIPGSMYACNGTKYEFKDACYLKCARGSRPGSGSQHITCQADRTWTKSAACVDEPVFRSCPLNLIFFSDRGVSRTNVTWPNVTAIYPSTNKTARVVLATSKPRGTYFDEGVHQVTYHANNSLGRRSEKLCSFTVTVQTIRCPHPNLHPGGKDLMVYNCGDYRYGAVCPVSCKSGYPLGGPDHIVCEKDASFPPVATWTWNKTSGLTPYCMVVQCPAPKNISGGMYACHGTKYEFKDACYLKCASGSRPGSGNQHITCQADRTWTKSAPCVDEPVFRSCPLNLTSFSDRGVSRTNVTWPNVTAIYPSTNKTARVVLATSKPRGTYFDEGVHQVTYHAYDSLGRRSEKLCSFTVTVQTIRCPHPNLHPGGKDLMVYNCGDYRYGAVCPVSCKSGYPLGGPDHIVCEKDASFPPVATWTWNKTSGLTPYCMERNCSDLTSPANGAMVCDKWMHGRMCQMQCDASYSFPRSAPHDGMFVCGGVKGSWMPTEHVPDCVSYSGFSTMRMPAYFYYNGSCPGNPGVQNQIKQNFIKAVTSSLKYGFESCTDVKACQPDNVQVICGKVTRDLSGPGSKDSLTIKFDVVVAYDDSKGSGPDALGFNDQRLHTVAAKLQTLAQTNSLGLDKFGLKLDKANVEPQTASLDCPTGRMPDMAKGICVGCPRGSHLDSSTKTCVDCPVGSYQDRDSSATCLTCPDGMSTSTSGSKNMTNCKGICQPGFISPDGLEPCNPCPMGTFQGMPRNQQCSACPKGQITRSTAATVHKDCIDFDLSLQANGVAIFKAQPQPLSQLTFAMWLYLYDTVTESFDIATWQDPFTMKTSFALVLKNSLELIAGRSSRVTDIGLPARQWTHVALQADSQSGVVNLYVNGKLAGSQHMTLSGAFIPDGHRLTIRTSNNVPAVLSQVMVYDTVVPTTTISRLAASCSTRDTNYIIDQTDLTDLSDGVQHVVPSVCGELLQ